MMTVTLMCALPMSANAQKRKEKSDVGPTVGATLDDFSLNDQDGKKRTLSELLAAGPVALVFHRSADW